MFILKALFVNQYGREPYMLWVTKKSLVKSNLREIKKWFPDHKIVPNLGTNPEMRKQFFDFTMMTQGMQMCSYENVRDTPEIQAFKWDFVFADEVHRLKGGANPKPTQIWVTMRDVCRHAKFMYFLSGTPIVNKAEEMWAYLHIFSPERFPKVKGFLDEFTQVDYLNGQLTYKVDVDKLMNRALAGQMIHRTKLEVGMQLPDKERTFYYLDLEGKQKAYYEQMRDNFFVWLGNQEEKAMMTASVVIAQLNRLRQLALYPAGMTYVDADGREWKFDTDTESVKLDQTVDLIEEINDQVVVSSAQFREVLHELARRLEAVGKSVAVIDSATSHRTDEFEQAFQQGKIDVLLINMATGSEGLNLHKSPEFWPGGASHLIMLDLWWNPAKNIQMEDRIWRDGCKEPVTIHILQAEDTVDAYVASIVEEKEGIIDPIMNDDRLRPASEWRDLLSGKI
jgi:SNF2 family DNA or RNA helicase